MQPSSFIAASAEEAIAQIRAKLGPEAVVLNVRRMPSNGLARLWQRPMIEVLAHLPEPATTLAPAAEISPLSETLEQFRQQLHEIRQQVQSHSVREQAPVEKPVWEPARVEVSAPAFAWETEDLKSGGWRVGQILQKSGLLPLHAQTVVDELRSQHGENPPSALSEEINLTQAVLSKFWRPASPVASNSLHVLVGPAGSGKTTSLCKWLTQAVLMEGHSARVWRLDGATANTAESLSVYADILGVVTERLWTTESSTTTEDVRFIDVPGVDWRNPLALKELAAQIKQFGSPRVHLLLNGAYDVSILLAQARAFSVLPIEDLIISHLDEETRWGKVWNLVLGTNYSVRQFSTGQNIPGDFHAATPEIIFSRQFPRK